MFFSFDSKIEYEYWNESSINQYWLRWMFVTVSECGDVREEAKTLGLTRNEMARIIAKWNKQTNKPLIEKDRYIYMCV